MLTHSAKKNLSGIFPMKYFLEPKTKRNMQKQKQEIFEIYRGFRKKQKSKFLEKIKNIGISPDSFHKWKKNQKINNLLYNLLHEQIIDVITDEEEILLRTKVKIIIELTILEKNKNILIRKIEEQKNN